MFINLVVDTGIPEVRQACGIAKDLSYKVDTDTGENFVGERRWIGGYFTTTDGSVFFDSDGANCGQKAYVLSLEADAPEKLPDIHDPQLKAVIRQAVDIVNSVRYKRCAPARAD